MADKTPSFNPQKPISKSNIVVTGGSRDIGGGIVLELAKYKANILAVFRSHLDRAEKLAQEAEKHGSKPMLLQTDLTTSQGLSEIFKIWDDKFKNNVDALILCASGSTLEINVTANMALVDKFLEIRKKKIESGEKLSLGKIIFLQSEPGHYQRVIDGAVEFLPYYRDQVGPAKRKGEDKLRERIPLLEKVGIRVIVICPPEVTDTFNMKLFELQDKSARVKSRQLSARLGTNLFATILEVAKTASKILETNDIPSGFTNLFGNVKDGLTLLSQIYGEKAIYIHTFEKVSEKEGLGHVIVNPKIWGEEDKKIYFGKLQNNEKLKATFQFKVTKEHMIDHFKLYPVLPGHKSIRIAANSLSVILSEKDFFLEEYESVKFIAPVIPGQKLLIEVLKNGNGKIYADKKETMIIEGMKLKTIQKNMQTTILLDQLVEAAAQTVGLVVLDNLKETNVLPLFIGTGQTKLLKKVDFADTLLIKTDKVNNMKVGTSQFFSCNVSVYKQELSGSDIQPKGIQGELIATINNLRGVLLPKEVVLDKLKG